MAKTGVITATVDGAFLENDILDISAYPSEPVIKIYVQVDGDGDNNSFGIDYLGGDFLAIKRIGNIIEIRPEINYDILEDGEYWCTACGAEYDERGDGICDECGGDLVGIGNTYREARLTIYSLLNSAYHYTITVRQANMEYSLEPIVDVKYETMDINGNKDVKVYLLENFPLDTNNDGVKKFSSETFPLRIKLKGGNQKCYVTPIRKLHKNPLNEWWEHVEFDNTLAIKYKSSEIDEIEHSTTYQYELTNYGRLHLAYEGDVIYRMTCCHLGDYKKNINIFFKYSKKEYEKS